MTAPTARLLNLIMMLIIGRTALGQAPVISYQSPQVFSANVPVAPVMPSNTGGPINGSQYGSATTFAGNGQYAYVDGPPTSASFRIPSAMIKDGAGNFYVTDFGNNVIRKISANGTVSTFAGSGSAGRNNGPATQAEFYAPSGIVRDVNGSTYVSESIGQTIRKITPAGDVSLFAGSGSLGNANGTGVLASFRNPNGMAIDAAGNIYVADTDNHLIRKITPAGEVTTYSGNGIAASTDGSGSTVSFGSPLALAFDHYGNLFVSDLYNNSIRKITPTGTVTTFVGTGSSKSVDGKGTAAGFANLGPIVFDDNDDMYVSDGGLLRKVSPDGMVTTIAGDANEGYVDGSASVARFGGLAGLAFGQDKALYAAELTNHVVRKILLSGYTVDKPLPAGLTLDPVSGTISGTPTAISPATDYLVTARNSSGKSEFTLRITIRGAQPPATTPPSISYKTPQIYTLNMPVSLPVQNSGGEVAPGGYSSDMPLPSGLTLDLNTGLISGTPTSVSPATIYTITAVNAAGRSHATINIKVTDVVLQVPPAPNITYTTPQQAILNTDVSISPSNTGGPVRRYSYLLMDIYAGSGKTGWTDGPRKDARFDGPARTITDVNGNLYLIDRNNNAVRKISPDGTVSTVIGPSNSGPILYGLSGLAMDSKGNIFVCDQTSVRKITPAGSVTILAGSNTFGYVDDSGSKARFDGPADIVIDENDNLYVSDQNNYAIRKITPQGVVTTIAGNRTRGNADGQGPAASFNSPQGLFYKDGYLYVADYLTIRKVSVTGTVTTIAGTTESKVADGPAATASFGNASSITMNDLGDMYILDVGNKVLNEGNAVLRLLDKDGLVSTVDIVNTDGNKTYLSGPNDIHFNDGVIYMPVSDNYIMSLSQDRFTIDKALPPGLSFDKLTGVISGKPTALSPATDYTITAYNSGGMSSTVLTLKVVLSEVKLPSVISFPEPPSPLFWDARHNYDPRVTSNQQETSIKLTTSNENVAAINPDNTIHVLGAGVVEIEATQAGSDNYLPAEPVKRTLNIVKAATTIVIADVAAKTTCSADFQLTATTNNDQTPLEYSSTDPTVATVSSTGNVHILKQGSTQLSVTQQGAPLYLAGTAPAQTLNVTVGAAVPGPEVKIIAQKVIYDGQPATFTASVTSSDVRSYDWMVNNAPVGEHGRSFTTSDLQINDAVSCVVTFADNCIVPSVGGPMIVTVLPAPVAIAPPNTFTPNGDGINDTWLIPALISYPTCNVSIFDRYGGQVFTSVGYSKAWDGTNGGKKLAAGTYYYIIDLRNGDNKVSGSVTILR